MEIKYFCSWWGIDHLGIEPMIKKIKDAGFNGIEIGIPYKSSAKSKLREILNKYNLEAIAHQYQANGNFDEYCLSFKESLVSAAEFHPLFINSHSGRDFWTLKENAKLIRIAMEVEKNTGTKIIHETHRKHLLFSTFTAKQYFDLIPELKINADFSHWTCVSESLLENQNEIIEEAIKRTEHIHARVGYEEGPQISDPRAPEWKLHLEVFTAWWQKIVDKFIDEGREYLTITPEFGPPPYTWTIPYSNKPVNDFFEINCWMKDYLKEKLVLS